MSATNVVRLALPHACLRERLATILYDLDDAYEPSNYGARAEALIDLLAERGLVVCSTADTRVALGHVDDLRSAIEALAR